MIKEIRNLIFGSKFLWFFVFFIRLINVLRFNFSNFLLSFNWLFSKSEFTNYNYELTELNEEQLVSFIAFITNSNFELVKKYFDEIKFDVGFLSHFQIRRSSLPRKRELPVTPNYARRLGWYALIRILKPEVVVETGTDKGMGTMLIAQALKKNGSGVVYTLDNDPYAGSLIDQNYWPNIKRLSGDSVENLNLIKNIDIFIHDSDHSYNHEISEYRAIANNISKSAIIISDNSEFTNALLDWSIKNNREFISFKENPKNHWYKGDGIGISLVKKNKI